MRCVRQGEISGNCSRKEAAWGFPWLAWQLAPPDRGRSGLHNCTRRIPSLPSRSCTSERPPGAARTRCLSEKLLEQNEGLLKWQASGQAHSGKADPRSPGRVTPATVLASPRLFPCNPTSHNEAVLLALQGVEVFGSAASWLNSVRVMDAYQVFQGSGSGHLSDRRCFSVARVPPGPAHHPSPPREGAFSSQQLLSFQLLLINFPKHFPLAQELPADGPRQGSKRGGLAKRPRRGAEKGLSLESKILRKTEAHTLQACLGDAEASRRFPGLWVRWTREETVSSLPDCQNKRNCRRVRAGREPSFQLTLKGCICRHTLPHTPTPLFHKENVGFPTLLPLANPGRSKEWSLGARD